MLQNKTLAHTHHTKVVTSFEMDIITKTVHVYTLKKCNMILCMQQTKLMVRGLYYLF